MKAVIGILLVLFLVTFAVGARTGLLLAIVLCGWLFYSSLKKLFGLFDTKGGKLEQCPQCLSLVNSKAAKCGECGSDLNFS
ncbi:hypothetical protein [Vibrio sinaloensis]|uniref:hypothetical protein n=1 Tax=Photobacterium sp. (strain ATCC 43367) TaxID=379097 RepID=UPI00057E0632|nr:hypothetical protein [Vibrio sinaloensis]KHT47255.1 hypothetical protein RJ46_11860 [Vibrio sinaloensis]